MKSIIRNRRNGSLGGRSVLATLLGTGAIALAAWPGDAPWARAQIAAEAAVFQNAADESERGEFAQVFLPPPRELVQQLNRAKKALAEGRFSDAVIELGELLEGRAAADDEVEHAEDYFIGSIDGGTQTSLKAEARRLIGEMPAAGREFYELKFGADARAQLEDAVSRLDESALMEISRRYFHTRAGYEATLLLGRLHLSEGRPLAAALCFQRVAEAPSARKLFDPELSFALATSLLCAGMNAEAEEALDDLRKRLPDAKVQIGGRETRLFAGDAPANANANEHGLSPALAALDNLLGPRNGRVGTDATQWLVYRGNAARNASAAGGMPLLHLRWRTPTVNNPVDEENLLRPILRQNQDSNQPSITTFQPITVHDVVLTRDAHKLWAVHLESGRRLWEFPWFNNANDTGSMAGPQGPGMPPSSGAATGPQLAKLQERLFDDAAYGQISSDGELAFALYEMGYANTGNPYTARGVQIGPGGIRQTNPDGPRDNCKLVALDIKREGKLRWMVGGENGEDEPQLAGAFFLGAPLPLHGQLFVIAELRSEIRLVVLDSKTGRLQWSQQLAHVDTFSILHDPTRRLAGASPSFADGVLVCPTSAGAVVAVDVATRSLLWGYRYSRPGFDPRQARFGRINVQQMRQRGQGAWRDATVTLAEGRVLFTPVESDEIYCLDLLTGATQWKNRREDGLFIACVHNGKVAVQGQHHLRAFNLADGKPAWSGAVALAGGSMPSGRGIYSEGSYFMPTSNGELLQIDLNAGNIVNRVSTGEPLGNLIAYKGQLLSQGADFLSAYHLVEPLREMVAALLEKNPNDAWALARHCELLLHEGRRAEALVELRKAVEADRGNHDLKLLLVSTLLAVLRDDFAANKHLAAEIETLFGKSAQQSGQTAQQLEFLRLMADGWRAEGELSKSLDAYLNLAMLQRQSSRIGMGDGPDRELERIDAVHSVQRDRLVQARVAALLASANETQRADLEHQLNLRMGEAIEAQSTEELRRLLALVGENDSTAGAQLHLVERLLDESEWREAERMLATLSQSADANVAGRAHELLARLYVGLERFEDAAAMYERLRDRYTDVECAPGKTGSQLAAEVAANEASPAHEYLTNPPRWNVGLVREKPWANANQPGEPGIRQRGGAAGLGMQRGRPFAVAIENNSRLLPPGTMVEVDAQFNTAVVRDRFGLGIAGMQLTRNDGVRTNLNNPGLCHAKAFGHFLYLSLGSEVMAIDLLRANHSSEQIMWRSDLINHFGANQGQVRIQWRTIGTPWGFVMNQGLDSQGNFVGELGPVTRHGVIVQRGRDVVCLDLLTGATVWMRGNLPPGCNLWGDDEMLVVAPLGERRATVLRMSDGELLGQRDVPAFETRWAKSGRNLLTWSQGRDGLSLDMYDPWEGKEIWSLDVALNSRGVLVDADAVAIMQPDGKFYLIRLSDGKRIVERQLEPEASLSKIFMLTGIDHYLLATDRGTTQRGDDQIVQAPGGLNMPLVTGRMYAFDKRTGEPLWKEPVEIDGFGVPLNQPEDLPMVVLLRQVTQNRVIRNGRRLAARSATTEAVVIDRRSGRVLAQHDEIPVASNSFDIFGAPEEDSVFLNLQGKPLQFEFTSEPLPQEEDNGAKAEDADAETPQQPDDAAADEVTEGARDERVILDAEDARAELIERIKMLERAPR